MNTSHITPMEPNKELADLRKQNAQLTRERNHFQAECLSNLRRINALERQLRGERDADGDDDAD